MVVPVKVPSISQVDRFENDFYEIVILDIISLSIKGLKQRHNKYKYKGGINICGGITKPQSTK